MKKPIKVENLPQTRMAEQKYIIPIIRPVRGDSTQVIRFNKAEMRFEFAWDTGNDPVLDWEPMGWEMWIGGDAGSINDIRESLQALLTLLNATCPPKRKKS